MLRDMECILIGIIVVYICYEYLALIQPCVSEILNKIANIFRRIK